MLDTCVYVRMMVAIAWCVSTSKQYRSMLCERKGVQDALLFSLIEQIPGKWRLHENGSQQITADCHTQVVVLCK